MNARSTKGNPIGEDVHDSSRGYRRYNKGLLRSNINTAITHRVYPIVCASRNQLKVDLQRRCVRCVQSVSISTGLSLRCQRSFRCRCPCCRSRCRSARMDEHLRPMSIILRKYLRQRCCQSQHRQGRSCRCRIRLLRSCRCQQSCRSVEYHQHCA